MSSSYSQQFIYGTGSLVAQRTDVLYGTPVQFGVLQDVSVDIEAAMEELHGQNKFAVALAPGKNKISVKAKAAGVRGRIYNDLFFGMNATTTNTVQFVGGEADTVPAATTYTVTVANAATFLEDWGVTYANGTAFSQVGSAPTVGQYSVNMATGVYTFAAADASAAVLISYTYTKASAGGLIIPITNQLMGAGPTFSIVLNQPFDSRAQTLVLNSCKTSKISLPSVNDKFTITELDFMVSADQNGNIGTLTTSVY